METLWWCFEFNHHRYYSLVLTLPVIPIVSPAEASNLAAKYREEGFKTLKLKVGKNLKADIQVLQAIREVHPASSFILDANEGYKTEEAIEVLQKLYDNLKLL